LKIIIITPWYPNRIHSQDGNFVQTQVLGLALSHDIELLTVTEDNSLVNGVRELEVFSDPNLRVIRCYYSGRGARVQRIGQRSKAWKKAFATRELSPDLIHAHVLIDGGIMAARLAATLNVPFLITEHSHRYLEDWPLYRKPELWLARRAARHASRLLPVSPSLKRGMVNHGIQGNYTVVPNTINDQLYFPTPRPDDQPFTFLHVSDFSPNKNLEDLLTAFAAASKKYPGALLKIAGNGDKEVVKALINTLGLGPSQTSLTGPHSQAEVADLMRSSDVFLLTSTLETQSLVLIEALLSGLPCISTRCGGPADILDDKKKGILVPVNDILALRKAMADHLNNGPSSFPDRQQRSDAARAKYTQTRSQLNGIYHNVLVAKT
jgi:glycosyltransferase involved in cell wall biosynthesis